MMVKLVSWNRSRSAKKDSSSLVLYNNEDRWLTAEARKTDGPRPMTAVAPRSFQTELSTAPLCRAAAPWSLQAELSTAPLWRDAAPRSLHTELSTGPLCRVAAPWRLQTELSTAPLCRAAAPRRLQTELSTAPLCRAAARRSLQTELSTVPLCRDAAPRRLLRYLRLRCAGMLHHDASRRHPPTTALQHPGTVEPSIGPIDGSTVPGCCMAVVGECLSYTYRAWNI